MMFILDLLCLFMTKMSIEKSILNLYCMNMYAVLSLCLWIWNILYDLDDLMLFVVSFDSNMLSYDNVVCYN